MANESLNVIASKGKFVGSLIIYAAQIASFAAAVYGLPYVKDLIAPYLGNYAWAIPVAAIIVTWAVMVFVIPPLIYFLVAQVLR